MIAWQERYGCDADGNRGVLQWEYELEPSDEPEIIEQLFEQLVDETDTSSVRELPMCTVTMICPYTDFNLEFEIAPSDFISQKEWDEFKARDM